jgi:glucose-6-phosphate 1-dehydrogenase
MSAGYSAELAPPRGVASARADAMVLFGATGDLARKKLFPTLYGLAKRNRLGLRVVEACRRPSRSADNTPTMPSAANAAP